MWKPIGLGAMALTLSACGGNQSTESAAVGDERGATAMVASQPADMNASPERNAYFGDLHIHTRNSFDAYIFNVRRTPDDAYRFALGETLLHPSGFEIKLGGPPLDFMAVTDHGEYLGILPAMDTPGTKLNELEMSKDMFSTDQQKIIDAFQNVGSSVRSGEPIEQIDDRELVNSVWGETVDAAERFYEPGKFTTFAAYEYTSVVSVEGEDGTFGGGNLHRNVFFKGAAPDKLFSTLNSKNPEDLWDWLDTQRSEGRDAIAIPHNSNVSNGGMFALETYDGAPLDAAYAEQRMRNEPLVEITQVKGTSETHPALSPNDEWADFEIYEELLGSNIVSLVSGGYAREALARGVGLENGKGFNPFKFGFVAASDTHVAGGAFDEKDYWSKVGIIDGLAVSRGSVPPGGAKTWEGLEPSPNAQHWFSKWSASGFAGVWAEENTRESIFDAMRRKETFATSGPRIKVRFFGGYGFDAALLDDPALVSKAYAEGVPMGGDLLGTGEAPTFLAWAMRDPRGAPLQRLQVIKAWSENGEAREAVFDAACSDGLQPDPQTHRCADNGAAVDLADCSISTDAGAPEIRALWRDPTFKADERAAYYVRVIENPTCRWSTWDAIKAGVERNRDLPATLQERAWTSPIWYTPG